MSPAPVKILVPYDSLTGNVERMAALVAEGAREIPGVEVRLRKVEGEGELRARPRSHPSRTRREEVSAVASGGRSPGPPPAIDAR